MGIGDGQFRVEALPLHWQRQAGIIETEEDAGDVVAATVGQGFLHQQFQTLAGIQSLIHHFLDAGIRHLAMQAIGTAEQPVAPAQG
jgi:hypothetical protein